MKRITNKIKTNEDFIRRAILVHGYKYDYSKSDVNNKNKNGEVCILCPRHGEFWQQPSAHVNGCGCNKCALEKRKNKRKLTQQTFIEECKKIHNNKYDYSLVEYKRAHDKIIVICPEHGKFEIEANSHLRGNGCSKCSNNRRLTKDEFIERARKIHGDRYDYSKVVYKNNSTDVCIICPEHGEFWQMPSNHVNGKYSQGCPKCKESKLERKVRTFLEENEIEYIYEARKKNLPWLGKMTLDFYLPHYNVAIECQGEQHYIPSTFGSKEKDKFTFLNELKTRDTKKLQRCTENGVKLFYFTDSKLKQYDSSAFTDICELFNAISSFKC